MKSSHLFARGASLSALLVLSATPVLAQGKGDRAQTAIAEARGKVDAANKAGTTNVTPGLQARAQAALRAAEEDVAAGHKEQAIADANNASELADTAIGQANKSRVEASRVEHENAIAATTSAQQDAAAANARADSAEQAAAAASAQADALRNQPPVVAAAAPTTTTVTTEEKDVRSAATHPAKHVVHHTTTAPATAAVKKTTTTVTTASAATPQ